MIARTALSQLSAEYPGSVSAILKALLTPTIAPEIRTGDLSGLVAELTSSASDLQRGCVR
jgi:hypothetical protein